MSQNIYHKIKNSIHTFQIVETYDYGTQSYILLNADGKECILVKVLKLKKDHTLYLSSIKYNPHCATNATMERGEETVAMIKAFLRFMYMKESFDTIVFHDASTFLCRLESLNKFNNDEEDDYAIPIPIAFHNLTIYGKTWYQRHFAATLKDTYVWNKLQKALVKLNQTIVHGPILNRMKVVFEGLMQSPEQSRFQRVIQYALQRIDAHINKTSWMQYFNDLFGPSGSVYSIYGKEFACSLYYTLDSSINGLFNIPPECDSLEMELSRKTIESYPPIEYLGIDNEPKHVKLQIGSGVLKRIPPHIRLTRYYERRSLRNRKKQ
jgi:hypothetical protein